MKINRRKALFVAAQALLAARVPARAAEQPRRGAGYPDHPIRMIVPYPAGGPSDIVARTLAEQLAILLGQPVVVDNRPGANGVIGNGTVANARPDGYTLLLTLDASLTVNPALYANLPYDPAKDFSPIGLVADNVNVLVVNRESPVVSAQQFVSSGNTRPIMIATGGKGTPSHLAAELLRRQTGVKLTVVPYKGSPPALMSVLSGETQGTFAAVSAAMPHLNGKLRALAVPSPHRSPLLPDVPTMQETGIPGVEPDGWYALLAPAGLPRAIRKRLNAGVNATLQLPGVRAALLKQGIATLGGTPEALAQRIVDESGFWARLVNDADIKMD